MAQNPIQLSASSDKRFLMAKATLSSECRGKATPNEREGYSIMQYEGRTAITLTPGKTIPATSPVYWVFEADTYTVDVPWGFRVGRGDSAFAVNGTLTVTVKASGKELCRIQSIGWERVEDRQNNVTYEYLSDHFINSEGKHDGLSIFFRRLYIDELRKCVDEAVGTSSGTPSEKSILNALANAVLNNKPNGWDIKLCEKINVIHVTGDSSHDKSH